MKIGKTVGLRPDDEMITAIKHLSKHLGTENLSQIMRTTFMTGYRQIVEPGSAALAFSRQAFREGVLQGAAAVKSQLESAIAAALQEAPNE